MTTIETHSSLRSRHIMDQIMLVKALKDGIDCNSILERAVADRQQELQTDAVQLKDRLLYKIAQTKENQLDIVKDIAETNLFEDANIKKQKAQEALDELRPVILELKEKVEVSKEELLETKKNTELLTNQLRTFEKELKKGNEHSLQEPLSKIGNQLCHYINKEGNNL